MNGPPSLAFQQLKPEFNRLLDPAEDEKPKVTQNIRKKLEKLSALTDLTAESGVLTFPLQFLIPKEKGINSTLLVELVSVYAAILEKCRFESVQQIQIHYSIIPG